jgi:hypothetical protein
MWSITKWDPLGAPDAAIVSRDNAQQESPLGSTRSQGPS